MSIGQRATVLVKCDYPACTAAFTPPVVGTLAEPARALAADVGWTRIPMLKRNGDIAPRWRGDACPDHSDLEQHWPAEFTALQRRIARLERELAEARVGA